MKPEDILCCRCAHFEPIMWNFDNTDEWIGRPCEHSRFMHTKCRDFEEYVEDKS